MRSRIVAGGLCTAVGCALAWITPAQATIVHKFEGSFAGPGSGAGQLSGPKGIAVEDATHDVYVVDSGNDRVEQFSSSGTFIREFNGSGANAWEGKAAPSGRFSSPTQIAIDDSENPLDPSAGDVYVVDSGHGVIDKFSAGGAYEDQISGTCEREGEAPPACAKFAAFPVGEYQGVTAVAIDPNGVVWAAQNGYGGEIDSFGDAQPNQYLAKRATEFGATGGWSGLAVDAEDDIYLNVKWIVKLNTAGETLNNPFCEDETYNTNVYGGVAVHSGGNDTKGREAYVDYGGSVEACTLGGGVGGQGRPLESFGSGQLGASRGVAVDASGAVPYDGAVYATDAASDRVAIFLAYTLPTVAVSAPSEQQPRSVTLNGTVNPEGYPVSSCAFEYATEEEFAAKGYTHSAICSPSNPGSGETPVPVSAHLTGLIPETTYRCRLLAANSGGASEASCDFFAGPRLGGEFATDVRATSATLGAAIDPNGADTHYYFQYGPTTEYGSYAPLGPPGADLGAAVGAQAIGLHVQGLVPRTVYHYRLVAEQAGETFAEEDRTFSTQPTEGGGLTLPDGRAWELVSPPDKKGALIEFLPAYSIELQSAGDGGGIAYGSFGPLGEDQQGRKVTSHELSEHCQGGWRTQDVTLPNALPGEGGEEPGRLLGGNPTQYRLFSPDLSLAAVEPDLHSPALSQPEMSEWTLYLRHTPRCQSGGFEPLLSDEGSGVAPENVPAGTKIETQHNYEKVSVYAATPDLGHLVLWSPVALSEGPYTELYELDTSGGKLVLIGVLPEGKLVESPHLAGVSGYKTGSVQRAISSDGRFVAWTGGTEPYKRPVPLYVRDMVAEKTVQVGGSDVRFQTMSADGSKVFYLEGGDLHLCELGTDASSGALECHTSDLTANHGAAEPSAGVEEIVSDVSEDGTYVYFVATGVLSSGENAMKEKAVSGQPNLYLLHGQSGSWSTRFIATLSGADEKSWYAELIFAPALEKVSSRVSPSGRYLAFMSSRSLTGYDNVDASSPPGEERRDEEVYLYDAAAESGHGKLVCASCNPTGARPTGILDQSPGPLVDRSGIWREGGDHWLAGSLPGWDEASFGRSVYQPRYLSNDGRLFFDSPDALVPQATNGLEDVYEYEPPKGPETAASDDCTPESPTYGERSGGCVSLISSGISSAESAFFDASGSGDDVFFITAAKLTGADYDKSYDVYDAHACGSGWSCVPEAGRVPECNEGESCKAPPSPQPQIFGPSPSATFSGQGNVAPLPTSAKIKPRARRLANALKQCRKKRNKRKRAACERRARRRYGAQGARRTAAGRGGAR
jgi:hypothetical protein